MIKKIYLESQTSEEDKNKFISTEIIQDTINELCLAEDKYVIAVDIASSNSKDSSCMLYYKKDENGNLIFQNTIYF